MSQKITPNAVGGDVLDDPFQSNVIFCKIVANLVTMRLRVILNGYSLSTFAFKLVIKTSPINQNLKAGARSAPLR